MSRAGQSNRDKPGGPRRESEGRIAGLARFGSSWRLVVLRAGPSPTLLESRSIESMTEAELARSLSRAGVTTLVRCVPLEETVCRVARVPRGIPADMSAAAELLAEAELPDSLPPHRRASGVVIQDDADAGEQVGAILTGWIGTGTPPDIEGVENLWVAIPSVLSVLLGGAGVGVYADRSEGVLAVVAANSGALAARVTREDEDNEAGWVTAITAAAAAVAKTVSLTPEDVPSMGVGGPAALRLPREAVTTLRTRISGVKDDSRWIAEYGLALGAALIAVSQSPCVRSMAGLAPEPPKIPVNPVVKVLRALMQPRAAWIAVAAGIALLLFAPLGAAYIRLRVAESRAKVLDSGRAEREETNRLAALYAQLEKDRWPVTKLMSDIAGVTPVGVELRSIRLSPEAGFAIEGAAKDTDLLNAYQANLNNTKIFRNLKINRTTTTESGVEFDMTADVAQPYAKVAGVEDFASQPLAVRLHGEGASNLSVAPKPVASTGRRTRSTSTADSGSASGSSPAASSGRPTPSNEPPAPISDADIAKLDLVATQREWVNRRVYPQKNPGLDSATKARLEEEMNKLRARLDTLKAQQSSGGGT